MNQQAISMLQAKLIRVAELVERRSMLDVDWSKDVFIQGSGWEAYVLRGECLVKCRELTRDLLKQPRWSERFSETYIGEKVSAILRASLDANAITGLGAAFQFFVEAHETYSTEHSVYLPIQSLVLKVPELQIGNVILLAVTDELLAAILEDTGNTKEFFFSKVPIWTIAKYCAVAEPTRALERAEEEVRAAMEVLNYALAYCWRPGERSPVGLQSDFVFGARSRIIRESVSGKWQVGGGIVGLPIELTEETVRHLAQSGWLRLSEILRSEKRSEFHKSLLASVHWFAHAQQQLDRPTRILALITALETMLNRKDSGPIANTVAEGVAFLLATDLVTRKAVKSQVARLYGLRNKISHGSHGEILQEDLKRLSVLARDFIYQLVWFEEQFSTRAELAEWIETQRLS